MMCAAQPEFELYRTLGQDNFADRLATGATPDWLMPISHDGNAGVQVWRVIG